VTRGIKKRGTRTPLQVRLTLALINTGCRGGAKKRWIALAIIELIKEFSKGEKTIERMG